MKVKIGEHAHRWIVHPRRGHRGGDLVLTSSTAVAVVNTVERFAVVIPSLKALGDRARLSELIFIRRDVIDRLLDAEEESKALPMPICSVVLSEEGVTVVAATEEKDSNVPV